MKTNITQMAGSAALALLLTACGGGGGGGSTGGASPGGTAESATTPQKMEAVVDQSDNFTDALCPDTVNGAAPGTDIDPDACLGEAQTTGTPDPSDLTGVLASFCPTAAASVDLSGVFDPSAFTAGFSNPQEFLTNGPLTFPVACLQEAATNLDQISGLIGANNPLTQQLCPAAAGADSFDPATCLSEITSGDGFGGLPGLPGLPGTGGSGGSIGGADFLSTFCPQAAAAGTSAQTPVDCLNEASRVYVTVVDMLTKTNPLYDALCPEQAASGRVQDPVGCFQEALGGGLSGGIPGLGDLPGLPGLPGGGDGGDGGVGGVPGLSDLTDKLSAICPSAIEAGVSPTTPIDCLTEAGQNLGGLENLLGGLGGGNPLTNALCPTTSGAASFDPTACVTEALGKLPNAGGGGVPQIPGVGMALEQICPSAAAGDIGPTTPVDCLMELGGNFGNLGDLLGGLGGSNPLTDALCPTAAASGSLDPAACFTEALQTLPGGLPIPGGGNGGGSGLPGFDGLPLVSQLCPNASAGDIGLTTPVDCLQEAGGNLGQIQNLLGGLGGANPLTDALCPTASGAGQLDPAACLTEALGALGNLPGAGGGSGGGQQIPGLSNVLTQICPTSAAGGVGPTTPIECLTEAGGNLGQLQDLLGGLAGGGNPLTDNPLTNALCPNAGGDPQACLTEALGRLGDLPGAGGGGQQIPVLSDALGQLCPTAAAGGVSPTTPVACLSELGGNLGQLQDLLGGLSGAGGDSNPLASLCPNNPSDPQACLTEVLGGLGDLQGLGQLEGLLGGLSGGSGGVPVVGDLLTQLTDLLGGGLGGLGG